MNSFTLSRRIASRPATVWAVVTDLGGVDRILSGVKAVEIPEPGPVGSGFRYRETRRYLGATHVEDLLVTEIDPERRHMSVTRGYGFSPYRTCLTVFAADDGADLVIEFELGGHSRSGVGTILRSLSSSSITGTARMVLQGDLDDLAAEAERRERADVTS